MRQNQKLYFYRLLTWWWPDSLRLMRLKCVLLRRCGLQIGADVRISSGVHFMGNGRIVIGDGCAIQHGVCVVTDGEGRGVIVLEDGASIGYGVHLEADGGRLMIGRDSEVRGHSMVAANGNASVHIGRHSRVAHFVSLKTSHHEIDPSGKCIGGRTIHSDISVGDGCWICAGAIIIPGVAVGEHCVIAAGAVVTHSCEAYSLYAGVPAMHKKSYKEEVMVRMKDVTANE